MVWLTHALLAILLEAAATLSRATAGPLLIGDPQFFLLSESTCIAILLYRTADWFPNVGVRGAVEVFEKRKMVLSSTGLSASCGG